MIRHSQLDSRAVVLMIVLCAAWGLQSVAIKVAVAEIAPVTQAAVRSLGAAALVLIWSMIRGIGLFERDGSLWVGIAAGLLFALEFLFLFWGIEYTTASRSILFLYTSPFVVALGAHWFLPGERMGKAQAAGLICAFLGVALAFGEGLRLPSRESLIGDALVLLGAVFWGATTVLIKAGRLATISPVKTLFYQLAVSGAALPLMAVAFGEPWPKLGEISRLAALSLFYQTALIAGISYVVWFWLISRYPASRLATFSFLTPLFGIVAGAVLLSEPVGWGLLGALVLVAVGIRLVNRPAPKAATERRATA